MELSNLVLDNSTFQLLEKIENVNATSDNSRYWVLHIGTA